MKISDIPQVSQTYWVVTLENRDGDIQFVTKESVEPRAGLEIVTSGDPMRALKIVNEDLASKFVKLIASHCSDKLGCQKIYIQEVRTKIEILDTKMLIDVNS